MRIRHYGLLANRTKHINSPRRAPPWIIPRLRPSPTPPESIEHSGCASPPRHPPVPALSQRPAACRSVSLLPARPRARRHEPPCRHTRTQPRSQALRHGPRSGSPAGAALTHFSASAIVNRIDHRPAGTDPNCACSARSASLPRPAATRRAPGRIQIPNTVALNPAVQSNRFYPPCCRTADKTLFVRARIRGVDDSGYNMARMAYEIILAPEAIEDLDDLKANLRTEVREGIETHLRHEPREDQPQPDQTTSKDVSTAVSAPDRGRAGVLRCDRASGRGAGDGT